MKNRISQQVARPQSLSIVPSVIPSATSPSATRQVTMLTLFHQMLCPHSRFARLALGEYRLEARLIEEKTWERRQDFLLLNPAGSIPVLVDDGKPPVCGASVLAEYLHESHGGTREGGALYPDDIGERAEVRRLAAWFNDKFHVEVSGPLTAERVFRRYMTREQGGGPPDTDAIRAARHNIRYHLAYIGWLVRTRNWLAGDELSYADLAAAAHISAADYLGDVPWTEDEAARNWYARVKSRPSFRPILADTLAGVPAAASYANLDF
jgi:glutathione S-transferase